MQFYSPVRRSFTPSAFIVQLHVGQLRLSWVRISVYHSVDVQGLKTLHIPLFPAMMSRKVTSRDGFIISDWNVPVTAIFSFAKVATLTDFRLRAFLSQLVKPQRRSSISRLIIAEEKYASWTFGKCLQPPATQCPQVFAHDVMRG